MIDHDNKVELINKREVTKSNNRSLIINAGIKVFMEKGVSEATVRDIIRFNYFSSKEEVLVAIVDDFALGIGQILRINKDKPKDFEEYLLIRITIFLNYVISRPELYLIMTNNQNIINNFSIITPQVILEIDFLKEEVKKGTEKGIFPEIDFELFALVLQPVVDALAQDMMLQKRPNVKECTNRCVNFLLNGLVENK
jgi:AcrR family transcriptional regulator